MVLAGLMVGLGLAIVLISSATLSIVPSLPHHNIPFWAGIPLFLTGLLASCYGILEVTSLADRRLLFFIKVGIKVHNT